MEENLDKVSKDLMGAWDDIVAFNNKYFPDWKKTQEIYLSNAMAGECGEICNLVKHRAGGGTNKKNPADAELLEEIADLCIYMVLMIETKGYRSVWFAKAIRDKLTVNRERMEARK